MPVVVALNKIDLKSLKGIDRVTLIRDYMLAFTRMGEPDAATKESLIKHLAPQFPTNDPALNRDLCEVLVYLGDASVVAGHPIRVDLAAQTVTVGNSVYPFEIRADWKKQLLNGWDDVDLTRSYAHEIEAFVAADRGTRPWAQPRR